MTEGSSIQLPPDLSIPDATYRRSQRVGAKALLSDVRLHRLDADLLDFGVHGKLRVQLAVEMTVMPPSEGAFVVDMTYDLQIMRAAEEELDDGEMRDAPSADEPEPAVTIKLGVAGLYTCDELPDDLADEELEAFGASVGALALHPYAREAIGSIIQRFGLPVYFLPPMRVYSDSPL